MERYEQKGDEELGKRRKPERGEGNGGEEKSMNILGRSNGLCKACDGGKHGVRKGV